MTSGGATPEDSVLTSSTTDANLTNRYLVPMMSGPQRITYLFLMTTYLLALIQFWYWWLEPGHNIGTGRFILNTLLVFWTTIIPLYFFIIVGLGRIPNPALTPRRDWRVAMVVTKAPSEPEQMVQKTLLAMLAQQFPHDTWLADEDPTPQMIDWCDRHGVKLSTRKGIAEYHQLDWPRRTRSKEGNLAYFYDTYGYGNYDFVSQLDADHVPEPGYLEAMLVPFLDPKVGYVSAPSQCDANAEQSWSARGRLQVEAPLHGALQAGYNGGLAPLCIGSHYAVRTLALKEVGGLGPELAEDHSTTLLMNSRGWCGVHSLDAHAHGDGPATFTDMVIQEFQWSRSLMKVLLKYTPHYLDGLGLRLKVQFLFSELWYTLFSLTMLATVVLPIVALLTSKAWVGIAYIEFFIRMSLVTLAVLAVVYWIRQQGWCRPTTKIVSIESLLFLFTRWPWNLLGAVLGIYEFLTGRNSPFKVTPKGDDTTTPLRFRMIAVYLLISAVSITTALGISSPGNAKGFYLFTLINGAVYLTVAANISLRHFIERRKLTLSETAEQPSLLRPTVMSTTIAGLAAGLVVGVVLRLPPAIDGILWGTNLNTKPSIAEQIIAKELAFGIYDRSHAFRDANYIKVEHEFFSWLEEDFDTRLTTFVEYAQAHNRMPMVSMEPWSDGREGELTLLNGITGGYYDSLMKQRCKKLRSLDMPLFIRFGHEMEVPTGRYPWADLDSNSYIRAYRRFVDVCRAEDSEFFFVWSPRGDGPHHKYYPGADYVDHVGLSLYSHYEYELSENGNIRSFSKMLAERYEHAKFYGKPIYLAEFGVNGDMGWRRLWLSEGLAKLLEFPLVEGLIYFNSADHPEAWGPDYSTPDWTIDPKVFTE